MASVFTFDPDPPRVSSPWGTPGSSTPEPSAVGAKGDNAVELDIPQPSGQTPFLLANPGMRKLEAEPQEGATEYKLHLLLRPRRSFSFTSTNQLVSGSHHSKSRLSSSGSQPAQDTIENNLRLPQGSSNQTRQHRLEQLTTQLLWRLQQSSPYHSSSTADLVLPILPEATPQLNVPQTPGRLLAGLEESQGALYEIGVSDDGTFVGLASDEMDESLSNLRAMAASLGCKVEVLRRVAVGSCEWSESDGALKPSFRLRSETLWVAEALVKPDLSLNGHNANGTDNKVNRNGFPQAASAIAPTLATSEPQSYTSQIRISVTGATTSGKSSLIGTLSTSTLDNGRGKSRLSLLKHRHEIESGITSSVAQELVGHSNKSFTPHMSADVVNYASGNVSSWNDIHAGSEGGRLVFISDSAGHPRYQKTILRSLMSWNPHWTLLCVAADDCEENAGKAGATSSAQDILGSSAAGLDLSIAHLDLCIALELPLVVVITKLDLASKMGLRQTLAKILSVLKSAGRKPLMLSSPTENADHGLDLQHVSKTQKEETANAIASLSIDIHHVVPIVFTSAVSGAGIGKVHSLLKSLPIPPHNSLDTLPDSVGPRSASTLFQLDEVYEISPSKIYIPNSDTSNNTNMGIILSGHVRYGSISIGDELLVGPITIDTSLDAVSNDPLHRSNSFPDRRASSKPLSKIVSFPKQRLIWGDSRSLTVALDPRIETEWLKVRVVSLRNLRLPIRKLLPGQVGTVGIEISSCAAPSSSPTSPSLLSRVRKGHVLADFGTAPTAASYSGFVASFPRGIASSLAVGSSTIIYTASIRAAAKITEVTTPSIFSSLLVKPELPTGALDLFTFDDSGTDSEEEGTEASSFDGSTRESRISFALHSSVEWFELGTKVFVLPTAGSAAAGAGTGLEGFVGRIVNGIQACR